MLFVAQPLLLSSTSQDAWWDAVESWRRQEKPPAFGHPMLAEFDLDPKYTNLNQGSYGSTPRRVRQATEALVLAAEANPDPGAAASRATAPTPCTSTSS